MLSYRIFAISILFFVGKKSLTNTPNHAFSDTNVFHYATVFSCIFLLVCPFYPLVTEPQLDKAVSPIIFSDNMSGAKKTVIFHIHCSGVIGVSLLWLQLVLCWRYFIPCCHFSLFLPSYPATTLVRTPFLHPAPFYTAQGLAETHTPLSPSLRLPHTPTSPAHGRKRGRKRKRKSCICLSEIKDCHLALTMYAHHP